MARTIAMVAALAATLLANSALALLPGSPQFAPGEPRAIFSIPDTQALWQNANRSPLGRAVTQMLTSPEVTSTDGYAMMEAQLNLIAEQTGFAMWPGALLGSTLKSLDAYVLDREGRPHSVYVFQFARPGLNNQVMEQVRQDATSAKGVSGGFAANTVDDREAQGRRYVHLPAFGLYLAVAGDSHMIMASTEEGLISSLRGTGKEYFFGSYVSTHATGLNVAKPHIWMLGDISRLAPVLTRTFTNVPLAGADQFRGVAAIEFADTHARLTTFTPHTEMTPDRRRIAMSAATPGPLPTLSYFAPDALFSVGSNNFDGMVFLDNALKSGTAGGVTGLSSQQVQEQMDATRETLGFDLRTDLLANIGPNLGFSLNSLEMPNAQNQLTTPRVDGLLVLGVRNRQRFNLVLEKVEALFVAPGEEGSEVLTTEEIGGQQARVLREPVLATVGVTPTYVIAPDGSFLLAFSPEALAAALRRRAGQDRSLATSPGMELVRPHIASATNQMLIIPGDRLAALVAAQDTTPIATNTVTPAQLAGLLSVAKVMAQSTIFAREGKKQEFVIAY